MASPNLSTFDLVPPVRPGLDAFNGIVKIDDQNDSPDPTSMPNAAEWNTMEFLILAMGRVCPLAILSVLGGASPSLSGFVCVATNVSTATFSFLRNSVGNVSITWPAGTFPPSTTLPNVGLNAGPGMIHAINIANGIQVFTYNASGVATDLNFSASVF